MDSGICFFLVVLWDLSEHKIALCYLFFFIIGEHELTLFGPFKYSGEASECRVSKHSLLRLLGPQCATAHRLSKNLPPRVVVDDQRESACKALRETLLMVWTPIIATISTNLFSIKR